MKSKENHLEDENKVKARYKQLNTWFRETTLALPDVRHANREEKHVGHFLQDLRIYENLATLLTQQIIIYVCAPWQKPT